jgi:hypothetical protein
MLSENSLVIDSRTSRMCVRQRLAHHHDHVVRHDQRELAVRGGRVEVGRRGEQPLGGRADRLDLLGQLLAQRRQHVLSVLADEQLIAEVPAQPGQRRARGRLGHAEPLRGPGHAALPDQLTQRDEQVQIKIGQVGDGAHSPSIQRSRPRSGPPPRRSPLRPWSRPRARPAGSRL